MPIILRVGGVFWIAMVLHCLLVQKEFRIGSRWAWLMVLLVLPPLGPWIYLAAIVLRVDEWFAGLVAGMRGRGGRSGRGGPPGGVKCLTCRHYLKHDQDGVQCGYGQRRVWKNYVQVGWCGDHTPLSDGGEARR